MNWTNIKHHRGFTLVELMVTLVMSSLVIGGLYQFLIKQRRTVTNQRMKANVQSLSQIAFFVIGRDIRRAGSNPLGWGTYAAGEPIVFEEATQNRIVIRADLDGDGDVEDDTEEKVAYEYVDSTEDADTEPDHIRRQAGDQLVIENVRNFEFCYWLVGGYWDCNPDSTEIALIRKVRMKMEAGTGRINQDTGQEDTKELEMIIRPRNFDM